MVGVVGRQWTELVLFDAGDDLLGSVHGPPGARKPSTATRALEVARCPVCRRRDPAREREATWWMGLGCAAIGLPWLALLALRRVAWSDAGARWAVAIAVVGSGVAVATVWGQVVRLERAEKIRLTPRPSRAAGP